MSSTTTTECFQHKIGIRECPYQFSRGFLPATKVSTSSPCSSQNTPTLLGTNTVIISLAFIVSAVSIVCAANKWYKFLSSYSSPALEEYREMQVRFHERERARRRAASAAAVAAAAEEAEEAAERRRVEELYASIASTSASYKAQLQYGSESSSSSSSPEIHPASASSSSRYSLGSPRAEYAHLGRHTIFTA